MFGRPRCERLARNPQLPVPSVRRYHYSKLTPLHFVLPQCTDQLIPSLPIARVTELTYTISSFSKSMTFCCAGVQVLGSAGEGRAIVASADVVGSTAYGWSRSFGAGVGAFLGGRFGQG